MSAYNTIHFSPGGTVGKRGPLLRDRSPVRIRPGAPHLQEDDKPLAVAERSNEYSIDTIPCQLWLCG